MGNQKEIKKIVNRIIKKYKPERIILFGSFARGEPTKDSDLDLFIVKKTRKDPIRRCYDVRRIIEPMLPLDILVFNSQEIKKRLNLGDFFIKEIMDNGKILYEKKQ